MDFGEPRIIWLIIHEFVTFDGEEVEAPSHVRHKLHLLWFLRPRFPSNHSCEKCTCESLLCMLKINEIVLDLIFPL